MKSKSKSIRPANAKEQKFVNLALKTGDFKTAAAYAYPDNQSPATKARQLLQRSSVLLYMRKQLMIANGPQVILDKYFELLNAKKHKQGCKDHDNCYCPPDNNAQLKAAGELRTLLGVVDNERTEESKAITRNLDEEPKVILDYILQTGEYPDAETRKVLLGDGPAS